MCTFKDTTFDEIWYLGVKLIITLLPRLPKSCIQAKPLESIMGCKNLFCARLTMLRTSHVLFQDSSQLSCEVNSLIFLNDMFVTANE